MAAHFIPSSQERQAEDWSQAQAALERAYHAAIDLLDRLPNYTGNHRSSACIESNLRRVAAELQLQPLHR